ncbi:MAG: ATP-binding protein [Eggerthellaceae bacterium]
MLGNALSSRIPTVHQVTLDSCPAPVGYGRYRFTVSDTGVSMSPDSSSTSSTFGASAPPPSAVSGPGLGMAITKNLVDAMRHYFREAPRQGTSFTLS